MFFRNAFALNFVANQALFRDPAADITQPEDNRKTRLSHLNGEKKKHFTSFASRALKYPNALQIFIHSGT
jgi:hypothetical protein